MTLNDLKEEAKKLVALLEDPQPGLFSWSMFVKDRIDNISRVKIEGLGPFTPELKK